MKRASQRILKGIMAIRRTSYARRALAQNCEFISHKLIDIDSEEEKSITSEFIINNTKNLSDLFKYLSKRIVVAKSMFERI